MDFGPLGETNIHLCDTNMLNKFWNCSQLFQRYHWIAFLKFMSNDVIYTY